MSPLAYAIALLAALGVQVAPLQPPPQDPVKGCVYKQVPQTVNGRTQYNYDFVCN